MFLKNDKQETENSFLPGKTFLLLVVSPFVVSVLLVEFMKSLYHIGLLNTFTYGVMFISTVIVVCTAVSSVLKLSKQPNLVYVHEEIEENGLYDEFTEQYD